MCFGSTGKFATVAGLTSTVGCDYIATTQLLVVRGVRLPGAGVRHDGGSGPLCEAGSSSTGDPAELFLGIAIRSRACSIQSMSITSEGNDGWVEGLPEQPGDYWFYEVTAAYPGLSVPKQGRTELCSDGRLMSIARDFIREESYGRPTRRIWHKPLVLPDPPVFDSKCPTCAERSEWHKLHCGDCLGTGHLGPKAKQQ